MSNTITYFHGVGTLPIKITPRPLMNQVEYEDQLLQEIQQRHEGEILSRPHAYTWELTPELGCEYAVRIFTSKPLDQIGNDEMKKLQKPVGEFKVTLEYQDGLPNG